MRRPPPSLLHAALAAASLLAAVAGCNARDGATDVAPRDASLDAAATDADTGAPDAGPDAVALDADVVDVAEAGPPFVSAPYVGPPPAVSPHDATVALPAACGVSAPLPCDPLSNEGCAAGETCDLSADGTFPCFALSNPVAVGEACDGLRSPYCAPGATCVTWRAT